MMEWFKKKKRRENIKITCHFICCITKLSTYRGTNVFLCGFCPRNIQKIYWPLETSTLEFLLTQDSQFRETEWKKTWLRIDTYWREREGEGRREKGEIKLFLLVHVTSIAVDVNHWRALKRRMRERKRTRKKKNDALTANIYILAYNIYILSVLINNLYLYCPWMSQKY